MSRLVLCVIRARASCCQTNLDLCYPLSQLKAEYKAKGRNFPMHLALQADNCVSENKNKFVLAFLSLLVAACDFEEITFNFLIGGYLGIGVRRPNPG